MKPIKLRLDKILILGKTETDYEEVRYDPSVWPEDLTGNSIPVEECAWDGEKVVDNRLGVAKEKQKQKINDAFDNNLANGFFPSAALGIEVDYRRTGVKNDLQNVEVLVAYMEKEMISETIYKGYEDQTAPANVMQLKTLIFEMQSFGVFLYNKKDTLKGQIDKATTIEEVQSINW